MATFGAPTPARLASREQEAIRLLFILCEAGVDPGPNAPTDTIRAIYGQLRLQALIFWVRNPDYMANEYLDAYDTGAEDALDEARAILMEEEPDIRRFPMIRYLFGAYEALDNALALLKAYGLATVHRQGVPGQIRQHDYFLFDAGKRVCDEIASAHSDLAWYRNSARRAAAIAGAAGGTELKARQYEQRAYASTTLGTCIAPIDSIVRDRLARALQAREIQHAS